MLNYQKQEKKVSDSKFSSLIRTDILIVALSCFLLFSGCVGLESKTDRAFNVQPLKVEVHEGKAISQKPENKNQKLEFENRKKKPRTPGVETETHKSVRLKSYGVTKGYRPVSPVEKNRFSSTEKVSVAVDKMQLSDFITYIFSDIFNLNFVISPSISTNELHSPVTLSLQQDITKDKLFSIVADVLARHKIIMASKDNIFFLDKDTGKKKITLGVGAREQDVPDSPGDISQLVPVQYIDTNSLLAFLPHSGSVRLNLAHGENMLILTGERDEVLRIMAMVRVLDRPALRGRFIGSFHLKYVNIADAVEKLKSLLREEGIPVARAAGGKGVFFIPLERQGILIYFAAQPKWISRLEYWIKIIDKPEKTQRKEYHVYFPENCLASTLFTSLKIMISGTSDDGERSVDKGSNLVKNSFKGGQGSKTVSKSTDFSVHGNDIKLSVDENRNALIIFATPEKYASIENLLTKLDIMPKQVLIQASIIEVTLTDKLQYGLEWYLNNNSTGTNAVLKTLGGLGLGSGGLDFSLVTSAQDFQLAINAMIKNDCVKVLSSPRITVRDGKTASIVVGTEVPVLTSEAVSADSVTSGSSDTIRSVQYRSTGISLNVTPVVHSRGVVTLTISVEVSEAQTNGTSSISSPLILNRNVSTEVVASDNQTILLGGLIKENKSDTVQKVPFLGDIPILGNLFKTTSTGGDRTELVVMITPNIIRNSFQIDEMRNAIFKSLKNIKKY